MISNSGRALEVFTEAVQLPAEERIAFLDRTCAGDEALRRKVEALLRSNDKAGSFLEEPPTVSISRTKAGCGEKPGDRVGRYKLVQQIGEGGCGIVFVAEQEVPVRRRVALKLIKPGMDTASVIARFEAERQALALIIRGSNSSSAAFFKCCKALSEFRLGNYEGAISWARVAAKGGFSAVKAEALAIIAMSQFRLHQFDQAQASLSDCNKVIDEKLPKLENGDLGSSWRDWLIAHALQEEAKRMIEPVPAALSTTPPR